MAVETHDITTVSWWVELAIRPGCLDDFENLTREMVTSTQVESGVLAYQRFISDDRQTVYVHERYEDSSAAAAHLAKFVLPVCEPVPGLYPHLLPP